MLIFWIYTLCNTGGINQRFGGNYCPRLQFKLKILTDITQRINLEVQDPNNLQLTSWATFLDSREENHKIDSQTNREFYSL